MKYLVLSIVFAAGYIAAQLAGPQAAADPPAKQPQYQEVGAANPAINMQGYLAVAQEAARHRASRRISEEDFIKMSDEKGTIVLDARSKEMYDLLHVKGAINLSFPDIAIASVAKTLPDKDARILIYCNNNFAPKPGTNPVAARAFMSKLPTASLNISTYIALYNYGYKNVYELAPLIDPAKSKLTLELTPKAAGR